MLPASVEQQSPVRAGRPTYIDLLPAEVQEKYQQALSNPDILSLQGELALSEVMIGITLRRLLAEPFDYAAAMEHFKTLDKGIAAGDVKAVTRSMEGLRDSLASFKDRSKDEMILREWIQGKRKLAATETDRLKALGQYASATEIANTLSRIISSACEIFAAYPIELKKFLHSVKELHVKFQQEES